MSKILLIIPGIGRGSDKFALRLARYLSKEYGYRFTIISRWFREVGENKYWLYDVHEHRIAGWKAHEKSEMIEFIKERGPYDIINYHTATIILDNDLDYIIKAAGRRASRIFVPHGSFVVRAFYREYLPYVRRFEREPKKTLDELLQSGAKPGYYEKGGKELERELKNWWSRPGNRFLLDALRIEDPYYPNPWQKWWILGFFYDLETLAIKKADRVIHVSNWIKNMFDKLYPNAHLNKGLVILDGIHYTEIVKDPSEREEIEYIKKYYKEFYGRKTNIRVWYVFIGAFAPEKGIFDLLSAFEAIRNRRNDVGLILVGGVRNLKIKAYIETAARRICYGCIHIYSHWYGNGLSDTELAGLLSALNELNKGVYVHPAWIEDFGLAPLEAAYFGLPVITYDHDGPKEVIIKNGLGIGVEPYNIDELVEKMMEVGNYIKEFSNVNKKRFIEDKFSFRRVIRDYSRVFQRL